MSYGLSLFIYLGSGPTERISRDLGSNLLRATLKSFFATAQSRPPSTIFRSRNPLSRC